MREVNEELAHLEARDVGKIFSEAIGDDVPSGTDSFDYFVARITAQNGDCNKWDKAIRGTPFVAQKVAKLLQAAGLPDGLFQIIHGDRDIGVAICEHPSVAKISLTGGVETGRMMITQSPQSLKKSHLNLAANRLCLYLMLAISNSGLKLR